MQRILSSVVWSGVAVAVMSGMPRRRSRLASRRSSIGRCSSATPRSPGRSCRPTASTCRSSSRSTARGTSGSRRPTSRLPTPRPITNDQKRPIGSYFWSRDSKYVLYSQDQGGDENFNVYAVDPKAAPAAGQPVPAARNLTDAKGVRALIYSVPKTRSRHHVRRHQRARQGLARPVQGRRSRLASARSCARTRTRSRGGCSTRPASCASARGPPTAAAPRSCVSTRTRSSRSTSAASSRPASRSASTRTARRPT